MSRSPRSAWIPLMLGLLMLPAPALAANYLCPKTLVQYPDAATCEQACGPICIQENSMKCGTYNPVTGKDIIFSCDDSYYCPGGPYSCDPQNNCSIPGICTTNIGTTDYTCSLNNRTFASPMECTNNCAYDSWKCNFPSAPQLDGKEYAQYTQSGDGWVFDSTDPYINCINDCETPSGCIKTITTEVEYSCMSNGQIYNTLNDCSLNCFAQPTSPKYECTDPALTLFDDYATCQANCDLTRYLCQPHVFEILYECPNPKVKGVYPSKIDCDSVCQGDLYRCFTNGRNFSSQTDCIGGCYPVCNRIQNEAGEYQGYECSSNKTLTPGTANESIDFEDCMLGCPDIDSMGTCQEKTQLARQYTCPVDNKTYWSKNQCEGSCERGKCLVDGTTTYYDSYSTCEQNCFSTTPTQGVCAMSAVQLQNYRCTWAGAAQSDFGMDLAACIAACTENLGPRYVCNMPSNPNVHLTPYLTAQDCGSNCGKCPFSSTPTETQLKAAVIAAGPYFTNGGSTLNYGCTGSSCLNEAGYYPNFSDYDIGWANWYLAGPYNPTTCSVPVIFTREFVTTGGPNCDCGGFFGGNTCCACRCGKMGPYQVSLITRGTCSYQDNFQDVHSCSNTYYDGYRCASTGAIFNGTVNNLDLTSRPLATEASGAVKQTDQSACSESCQTFSQGSCSYDRSMDCTETTVPVYMGYDCVVPGDSLPRFTINKTNDQAADLARCQEDCEVGLSDCTLGPSRQPCVIATFNQ